jgi:hypothetical protein
MRQQAKPFTVEIKKSRKSTQEPQSLFGDLLVAEAAPKPKNGGDALFGQQSEPAKSGGDVTGLFRPAVEPARPATRILPDLTVRQAQPSVEDEPARTRKPRLAKTKGPRQPKAKPLPVTLAKAPVERVAATPEPIPSVRVRRRPKDETGLARAERWKRRLPRFAR